MELLSPLCRGHIGRLVVRLSFKNKPLDVHPSQICVSVSLLLLSLCSSEFHEQNTDEKVQEEK